MSVVHASGIRHKAIYYSCVGTFITNIKQKQSQSKQSQRALCREKKKIDPTWSNKIFRIPILHTARNIYKHCFINYVFLIFRSLHCMYQSLFCIGSRNLSQIGISKQQRYNRYSTFYIDFLFLFCIFH